MNPRERVVGVLTHQPVDRLPHDPWALPGVVRYRSKEYEALLRDYPSDIIGPCVGYARGRRCAGEDSNTTGYTDAWGCRFEVKQNGIIGEVKQPVFDDGYDGLKNYELPWELFEGVKGRQDEIAFGCARTDKFVLAGTEVRPFERMQFLRGTENLYCDIALDEPGFYDLRDKLHQFFMDEMKFWASTAVDGVGFMDDWGSQRALLISPKKWREIFKPMYKAYADVLHDAGKFVFFHSDGYIEDIYPDLVEIGIDAVNSQLFCMDMERLGRDFSGRIAFRGEIDRQKILPFGSEEDVRAAVRRQYKALCPDGTLTGCFAQCEWGIYDPEANVRAVYDEWDRIAAEANR